MTDLQWFDWKDGIPRYITADGVPQDIPVAIRQKIIQAQKEEGMKSMTNLTPEGLRERARHTAWSCGSTNRPDLVACHDCIYDVFTVLVTEARRELVGLLRLISTEALGNPADEYVSVPTAYIREARRLTQEETP